MRFAETILFIFVFVRITMIPAALLIGFWFLTQLFSAGTVATAQTGGVAYLAHVGGFAFGALTARLFEDPRRLDAWPGCREFADFYSATHFVLLRSRKRP